MPLRFKIETEREEDGRRIAEPIGLPGVIAYGEDKNEAICKVKALVLNVLADPGSG